MLYARWALADVCASLDFKWRIIQHFFCKRGPQIALVSRWAFADFKHRGHFSCVRPQRISAAPSLALAVLNVCADHIFFVCAPRPARDIKMLRQSEGMSVTRVV